MLSNEKGFIQDKIYHSSKFLFFLTIIQFWWIAIWGIAYIVIDLISGPSKTIEFAIYVSMLVATFIVVHMNPSLLDKL